MNIIGPIHGSHGGKRYVQTYLIVSNVCNGVDSLCGGGKNAQMKGVQV